MRQEWLDLGAQLSTAFAFLWWGCSPLHPKERAVKGSSTEARQDLFEVQKGQAQFLFFFFLIKSPDIFFKNEECQSSYKNIGIF